VTQRQADAAIQMAGFPRLVPGGPARGLGNNLVSDALVERDWVSERTAPLRQFAMTLNAHHLAASRTGLSRKPRCHAQLRSDARCARASTAAT
jgi:hypothetical protein